MGRRRPRTRGQAILLAVVGLLVLAIGMYTSYNLSRAVYEKIQLQNAADATAYSLATMEARTFNFIAFANRAQVANYVQILESQSILSSATFVEGFTAWLGDYLQAAGRSLKLLSYIPGLGSLAAVGDTLRQLGEGLEKAYDEVLKPGLEQMDTWQPQYVRLKTAENQALLAVAAMLALSTELQLGDGAFHITQANDPGARRNWLSFILNGFNMVSYTTAFDLASFGKEEPKRVMTELAHAARHGTAPNSPADFVVARGPFAQIEGLLSAVSGGMDLGGRAGDRARDRLGGLFDLLNNLVPAFVGTGKLLTSDGESTDLEDTARHNPDHSGLARGDAVTAKDTFKSDAILVPPFNRSGMVFASVTSATDQSRHCRYKGKPSDYGRAWRIFVLPFARDFACEEEDGRHRWRALIGEGGIQPYLKFAPKLSGISAERTSFNQPDVWVYLNKPSAAMALAGGKDLDFQISQGRRRAALDARIAEEGLLNTGLGEGLHAIARAQVYYHRPGAWQEPPNFFNPFWGARLAPKNAAIKRLGSAVGLGDTLGQLIGDNIWMH